MPHAAHDTTTSRDVQAGFHDDWSREILPRLPEQFDQSAKDLKAFERSREISSAGDLLRGMLAYVFTVHSFPHLAMWSVLIGLADVSANDWRRRLRKACGWGQWLLEQLLCSEATLAPWVVREGYKRILLVDGTHLTCRGPKGMVYRVHTAFDLLAGRLTQLKVTDKYEAERLEVFEIQAGDLVISDAVNSSGERFRWIKERGGELLVRLNHKTLPLQEAEGTSFSLLSWLKSRRAPIGRGCSRRVWISQQGNSIPLRLIGLRLSEEQRKRGEHRKKREASRRQRALSAETLYLAGWLLVVTTLPQERFSDQEVLELYRTRWHIELIFKRIKQLLCLHRLRCTTAATALPTLVFVLVGWALMEQESSHIRLAMREAVQSTQQPQEMPSWQPKASATSWWQADLSGPLSEWMVAEIGVDLLRQQIRGGYTTARYRACLPRLQRFLCSGHRHRSQGYSQACVWLGEWPAEI
jgi:hypothetical protein